MPPTIQEQQAETLKGEIGTIVEQMAQISSTDIVGIPEDVFVNVFLPLFAGDEPLPYPVTVSRWIQLAGGAYKKVNVIAQGKVLFTVPALLQREIVNPVNSWSTSIDHVVKTAKQYSHISPLQGEEYLLAELSKRALLSAEGPEVQESILAWVAIFNRYGRSFSTELLKTEPHQEVQPNSSEPPDYDFEPL